MAEAKLKECTLADRDPTESDILESLEAWRFNKGLRYNVISKPQSIRTDAGSEAGGLGRC